MAAMDKQDANTHASFVNGSGGNDDIDSNNHNNSNNVNNNNNHTVNAHTLGTSGTMNDKTLSSSFSSSPSIMKSDSTHVSMMMMRSGGGSGSASGGGGLAMEVRGGGIAKLRQLIGLSNWAIFCDHLRSIAHATGLTGYLNGTIVAPSPQDTVSSIASSSQKTSTDDASTTPSAPTSTPSAPPPTPINSRTPSVEEWELRDGCLAGIIYQNIKDPRSIGVTEIMSAHEMWTRLTSEYDTSSAAAQALAKEHIQQFQYAPGTPFEEYFKQLEAPAKLRVMLGVKLLMKIFDPAS
ncbi:hypothetical protein EV361DRAFT_956023 [Lentinula raphanica]|nr:hypothetical protein EV361DRAFT_956023 [Lentinula raphanica]